MHGYGSILSRDRAMVRVEAADDGTFTLALNGRPVLTGLTRAQADRLSTSYEARQAKPVPAPAERLAPSPVRRFARLRDLLRLP